MVMLRILVLHVLDTERPLTESILYGTMDVLDDWATSATLDPGCNLTEKILTCIYIVSLPHVVSAISLNRRQDESTGSLTQVAEKLAH
jgi:hypothetical protein